MLCTLRTNYSQFDDYADELILLSNDQIKATMDTFKNAATTVTSLALASKQEWPEVVIPHYAERTNGYRELANVNFIAFSPLVQDNRQAWEEFSVANQGWTLEGYAFQGSAGALTPIPSDLHRDLESGASTSAVVPGPHAPVWQMSPVPDDLTTVNFDLEVDDRYSTLAHYVDEHRIPAISAVFPIAELLGKAYPSDSEAPKSIVLEPIYADFQDTSPAVGHYLAVVEWANFFSDILHQGANGIVVVLKNSCGQVFTFVVNGSEVTYIGNGDHHDSEYNEHRRSAQIFDPSATIRDQEDNHCFYSIDVYPSDTFKDEYTTRSPIIYTAVVFAVMLGTGLAFVLYEILVQRRQKALRAKVAKTNAIVSSLFPENVRDRLITGEDKKVGNRSKDKNSLVGKQGLKTFLDDAKVQDLNIGESKPIADLFPHTVSIGALLCSPNGSKSDHARNTLLPPRL
jgi:hypothetical protein